MSFSVTNKNSCEINISSSTLLVNGGWSGYGSWISCSVTCGGGTKSRSRSCTKPSPDNGGDECTGEATEAENCGTASCPGETIK